MPAWRQVYFAPLEKPEKMEALNFERLVADKDNLIMIEWPENVGIGEGVEVIKIRFEIRDGEHEIRLIQKLLVSE